MADQRFTIDQDGQKFSITVPEGEDPNEAITRVTGQQAAPEQESFGRGFARGSRPIVGAIPKMAGGLMDLAGAGLNLGLDAFSTLGGTPSAGRRFPTNMVDRIDETLDIVGFPTPETPGERISDLAVETLIPGLGLTGAAVKSARAPGALREAPTVLRGLGDDIAEFFVGKSAPAAGRPVRESLGDLVAPARGIAAEAGGSFGAATGDVLSEEEGLHPVLRSLATLVGGFGGGVAPAATVNLGRKAATGIANQLGKSDLRAAGAIQSRVAPEARAAAAQRAREAPEGVSAATATDEPGLQALENRALADDPGLDARVSRGLEEAEERNLSELAELSRGTDPGDFQHKVVQSVAPKGAQIVRGQTDEMIADAARAFNTAYSDVEGFAVQTRVMNVSGGDDMVPDVVARATSDPSVLVGDDVRRRVLKWLEGRFTALTRIGERVGGPDDMPIHQMESEDLLNLRSAVRSEARRRKRSPQADTQAEGELLNNAQREITGILESQLPPEALAKLQATDSKYRQFVTVEEASVRSTGLTGSALQQAIKQRKTLGQTARGDTGRLGQLADQGADLKTIFNKKDTQAAQRVVRSMTPEEQAVAKADFTGEVVRRAEGKVGGETRLKGARLLDELEQNRDVLKAAGFTDDDFAPIERIGRELKMIQGRSTKQVTELLEDNVGTVLRLLAAIGGTRAGTRALRLLGGSGGGAGPSFVLAQFGSQEMRKALSKLNVDGGEALIQRAMVPDDEGRELFAALLTKPTDPLKLQADHAQIINAWLARTAGEAADAEDE